MYCLSLSYHFFLTFLIAVKWVVSSIYGYTVVTDLRKPYIYIYIFIYRYNFIGRQQ